MLQGQGPLPVVGPSTCNFTGLRGRSEEAQPGDLVPRQNMTRETESHGSLNIDRERFPPTISEHAKSIEKIIRKPLPADFSAFYEASDGMTYLASRGGSSLGIDATLCGLASMFDGFKKHVQIKNEEAFDDFQGGDLYDAPFCGTIWSEDFGIEEKGDLTRFNTMLRAKLLVSVPGAPDALVVDFAPKTKKGVAKEYEILLVSSGNDVTPLDLDFPTFVWHFERFGAVGWYYAFVGAKSAKALNIDLAATVKNGMSVFGPDLAEEIAALVKQAGAGTIRRPSEAPR